MPNEPTPVTVEGVLSVVLVGFLIIGLILLAIEVLEMLARAVLQHWFV